MSSPITMSTPTHVPTFIKMADINSISCGQSYYNHKPNSDFILPPSYSFSHASIFLDQIYASRLKSVLEEVSNTARNNRKSDSANTILQPSSIAESCTDILMNESLERISASLQNLIEEAQASLSKSPSLQTKPRASNSSDNNIRPVSYIQERYAQSQEKVTVALEQLEKNIAQNNAINSIMTYVTATASLYYQLFKEPSPKIICSRIKYFFLKHKTAILFTAFLLLYRLPTFALLLYRSSNQPIISLVDQVHIRQQNQSPAHHIILNHLLFFILTTVMF